MSLEVFTAYVSCKEELYLFVENWFTDHCGSVPYLKKTFGFIAYKMFDKTCTYFFNFLALGLLLHWLQEDLVQIEEFIILVLDLFD